MRFLRTAPTGRLLAAIAGLIVAIVAGTAIAVAAVGSGPVAKREPLATAVHQALKAHAVQGVTADISFTNHLIDSSSLEGSNPLLSGATGRLWATKNHLRLELQSTNGDAQIVVNGRSFWISDPSSQTVYEGTLPADSGHKAAKAKTAGSDIPSIATIQNDLNKLMHRVDVSGARPGDVAGQAAYTVSVSPKHDGGLLGSVQLAWDAIRGVPLRFAVYARGSTSPVLELSADNIAYGSVPASDFAMSPPSGAKVVTVATAKTASATAAKGKAAKGKAAKRAHKLTHGVAAVQAKLPFALTAPASLVGLPRQSVALLSWGGKPAALVTYGKGLGGIAVIEQTATGQSSATQSSSSPGGVSLPTVSINGATGTELDTALGTVVHFSRSGVGYTVLGSVPSAAADAAARAL